MKDQLQNDIAELEELLSVKKSQLAKIELEDIKQVNETKPVDIFSERLTAILYG